MAWVKAEPQTQYSGFRFWRVVKTHCATGLTLRNKTMRLGKQVGTRQGRTTVKELFSQVLACHWRIFLENWPPVVISHARKGRKTYGEKKHRLIRAQSKMLRGVKETNRKDRIQCYPHFKNGQTLSFLEWFE